MSLNAEFGTTNTIGNWREITHFCNRKTKTRMSLFSMHLHLETPRFSNIPTTSECLWQLRRKHQFGWATLPFQQHRTQQANRQIRFSCYFKVGHRPERQRICSICRQCMQSRFTISGAQRSYRPLIHQHRQLWCTHCQRPWHTQHSWRGGCEGRALHELANPALLESFRRLFASDEFKISRENQQSAQHF